MADWWNRSTMDEKGRKRSLFLGCLDRTTNGKYSMRKSILVALSAVFVLSGCRFRVPNSLKKVVQGDTIVIEPFEANPITVELDIPDHPLATDFYYDQLGSDEQDIYNQIAEGCKQSLAEIPLNPTSREAFYKAQMAYSYDHPEVFWVHSFTMMTTKDQVVQVNYDIPEDAASTSKAIQDAAFEILRTMPSSDPYAQIKYLYEKLIEDTDYVDSNSQLDQDIRSVFLNHSSVCAGYTRAFQYLCDLAGIWCTMVTGTTTIQDSIGHTWNMVRLQDQYYWVDVTWGDPVFTNAEINAIDYNYLCVSDEQLLRTHVLDYGIRMSNYESENCFTYPACSDDSLNYYKLNGGWFDTYDRSTIFAYLQTHFLTFPGQEAPLKFATVDAYELAKQDLFDQGGLTGLLPSLYPNGCTYQYRLDEATAYIGIAVFGN